MSVFQIGAKPWVIALVSRVFAKVAKNGVFHEFHVKFYKIFIFLLNVCKLLCKLYNLSIDYHSPYSKQAWIHSSRSRNDGFVHLHSFYWNEIASSSFKSLFTLAAVYLTSCLRAYRCVTRVLTSTATTIVCFNLWVLRCPPIPVVDQHSSRWQDL